ncbi:MFS transporter [Amycolatopsis sp. WAC 01416]|uniref:MFS transporter n=1 Tax=Amycolatopsis sp. WAC 01416 TaxID=2203196 RepID=UPI000F78C93D|nr:MFS transporter [Amycolatopsis sp. WAC 01416]RSN22764.1 MFS transporter [Amycolatopsis sp. WAC 01416]
MDDDPGRLTIRRSPNRWVLLSVSLIAWAVGATAVFQLSLVLPALRAETGMSLALAGALVGVANGGLTVAMLGWGLFADRFGERCAMSCGLSLCALLLCVAAATDGVAALFAVFALVGATASSVYAPSGQAVVRRFPVRQRALALGLTQTATPLSSALAAAIVPGVAAAYGLSVVWLGMAGLCLLTALVVFLFCGQPRADGTPVVTASGGAEPVPWRRIYGACALLILPQSALLTFSVSYLVDDRGWSPVQAGWLLSGALLLTVLTRPLAGYLADRLGAPLGLMRIFAFGNAVVLLFVVIGAVTRTWLGTVMVLVACVSTITGYGLASTAVAGFAARARLGRALGVQHTLQSLMTTAGPVVLSAVIGKAGYAGAFAVIAVAPLAGGALLPVAAERPGQSRQQCSSTSVEGAPARMAWWTRRR